MKIHLKTSDDPLIAGQDMTANCGAKVSKAALKFWFDLEASEAASLNRVKICDACYCTRNNEGRYLAGIANGQEAMTEAVSA